MRNQRDEYLSRPERKPTLWPLRNVSTQISLLKIYIQIEGKAQGFFLISVSNGQERLIRDNFLAIMLINKTTTAKYYGRPFVYLFPHTTNLLQTSTQTFKKIPLFVEAYLLNKVENIVTHCAL